jgi:hypothetical protein
MLAGAFLLAVGVPQSRADCGEEARKTVTQFLKFDLEGYRLGSRGHEAIWELTDQNGEPPAEPVAVTKDYRVVSAVEKNGGCDLKVLVTVYGYITQTATGLLFERKPSNEEWDVIVRCKKEACKIRLGFAEFKLYPHPGIEATRKWLELLESIQTTAAGKAGYRSLRQRMATLR